MLKLGRRRALSICSVQFGGSDCERGLLGLTTTIGGKDKTYSPTIGPHV